MASVERRGQRDPHWRVVWRENGQRLYEKFPTPEQAEAYRHLVESNGNRRVAIPAPNELDPNRPTANRPCSFADWARFWMNTYSGPRDTTLAKYHRVVERDLIPVFGSLDISEITRQHDSAWVLQQQSVGASPKTIRNKHALLHQILQAAVDYEPVPMRVRNPITAQLPEVLHEEQRFLTREEFARLEAAMHPHYRPFLRFLVGTGTRYAEAAGLLVGRVRLLDDPPAVDVAQSWQKQADNTWALSPLKSKSSRRPIRLSATQVDDLVPLTAPHRSPTDFVFTTVTGRPLHHGYFWEGYWAPAVAKAELSGLRIHDLRHTHVAWLIEANTPLPVIMRRLGHSSITITIDRYGHLVPEVDTTAADAMERALARP